jgi:2-polyprenyl-6-methoxyphenol hydroxylase-like FAD-dependent oxidoreductase
MNVLVVGAGPAGLYFSYLARRRQPRWRIRVVEQNPPDATFGFGVVFSDKALEFLRGDDPQTYAAITPHMETWTDLTVVHRGTPVVIGLLAIRGRRMQQRAAWDEANFESELFPGAEKLRPCSSGGWRELVRPPHGRFNDHHRSAKVAWFGTPGSPHAHTPELQRHHYRHSPEMSTFVFECDATTWERAGFASMSETDTLSYGEKVFKETLGGHRLVSNKSVWRNFPNVRNTRWHAGNVVLIGDALRTAHFSIGSGTRLAMEDAIALAKSLVENENETAEALAAFEAARRPIVEKLVAAADASGNWYDRFPEHMRLAPRDFAWSYIQRSGRIDPARLRKISPKFVDG